MTQLTIFDVMQEFDDSQAHWTRTFDSHDMCTVTAIIPPEVLSPFENSHRYGTDEWKRIQQIWTNYTFAIYRCNGSWGSSRNELKKHRDAGTPCKMKVCRSSSGNGFRPDRVVEYLEVVGS